MIAPRRLFLVFVGVWCLRPDVTIAATTVQEHAPSKSQTRGDTSRAEHGVERSQPNNQNQLTSILQSYGWRAEPDGAGGALLFPADRPNAEHGDPMWRIMSATPTGSRADAQGYLGALRARLSPYGWRVEHGPNGGALLFPERSFDAQAPPFSSEAAVTASSNGPVGSRVLSAVVPPTVWRVDQGKDGRLVLLPQEPMAGQLSQGAAGHPVTVQATPPETTQNPPLSHAEPLPSSRATEPADQEMQGQQEDQSVSGELSISSENSATAAPEPRADGAATHSNRAASDEPATDSAETDPPPAQKVKTSSGGDEASPGDAETVASRAPRLTSKNRSRSAAPERDSRQAIRPAQAAPPAKVGKSIKPTIADPAKVAETPRKSPARSAYPQLARPDPRLYYYPYGPYAPRWTFPPAPQYFPGPHAYPYR